MEIDANDVDEGVVIDGQPASRLDDLKQAASEHDSVQATSEAEASGGQHASIEDTEQDFKSSVLPFFCVWPSPWRPKFIVRTNRDLVPEIPALPVASEARCIDGRFGLSEASQLPQMHDRDKWHMAFIPLLKPLHSEVPFHIGRPWWHLAHADMLGDLGWFRLEDVHLQPAGYMLYKLHWQILNRMETTELETSPEWQACIAKEPYHDQIRIPTDRYQKFAELTSSIRHQSLTKWDCYVNFAEWQRCLNEIRGWMAMVSKASDLCMGLEHFAPEVLPVLLSDAARRARVFRATRHVGAFRGVFTMEENVALLCASRDVPVWELAPYSQSYFHELRQKKEAGVLQWATYRKYGSELYVHKIERKRHREEQPVEDVTSFSRSTKAVTDAVWNGTEVVHFHDDLPVHAVTASASASASSSTAVVGSGSLSHARDTKLARPSAPANLPRSLHLAAPQVAEAGQLQAPQLAGASGGGALKRKAQALGDNANMPSKRRKAGKLAKASDSTVEPSQVQLMAGLVSSFTTVERPHWFPMGFAAAESIMHRVDITKKRYDELIAASELPVPLHLFEMRLHKVPLVSYFLNAWDVSRKANFDKRRTKGGVINVAAARPQEDKIPGLNVSKALRNWLRIRPFFLRRLTLTDASENPGMLAPDWRNVLKMMMPSKHTAKVVNMLGLEASLPQREPDVMSLPELEEDAAHDDDDIIPAPVQPTSQLSTPAPSMHSAANVCPDTKLSHPLPPASAPANPIPSPPLPLPLPLPDLQPSRPPPPAPELPRTVGDYLDRIGHPTFDGHVLPPFVTHEDIVWPSLEWRRYVLWELSELEFRYELFYLDLTIRQSHPDHTPLQFDGEQRYRQCMSCWGGSGFIPGMDPKSFNKLCHEDNRERLQSLWNFFLFMRPWPRAVGYLTPWENFVAGGGDISSLNCDSQLFFDLESSIWHCYGQLFLDYRHRLPPLPHIRPKMPVT